MLAEVVEKYLNNKKLSFADSKLNYNSNEAMQKINKIVDSINHIEGSVIGIMLPRSIDYILTILAIWKSGRAFVPLNYDWPKSYVNLIINKAKIKHVITNKKNLKIKKNIAIYPSKNLKNLPKRNFINQIAYIIFTSGSTGEPKGVQISQKSFLSYLNWVKENQKTKLKINHLITGEITFDIILADLAFIIANNTSIFITNDSKNAFGILNLIKRFKINSIYCVPSLLSQIVEAAKALSLAPINFSFVFCGGDIFKIKLYYQIKKFFKKAKIFNMYGPTECSMNSLAIELSKLKNLTKISSLPTGYQFKHLDYLLINEFGKSSNKGELLIGGNQLMDGYLNKENSKLIRPFIKVNNKWFYKTGDIFKKIKNLYYFLGRKNLINKISGFRINFSYIENLVEKINHIKEFKLFLENNVLYGFFTSNNKINSQSIKDFLEKKLPSYMIPKEIYSIKKFPLNNRGKIDFKKLLKQI